MVVLEVQAYGPSGEDPDDFNTWVVSNVRTKG